MARQFNRFAVAPLAGLAALVAPEVAAAGPATVDLVFRAPHFAKVADGRAVTYSFVRKAEDPGLAPSFADEVSVLVGPEDNRNSVSITLFTGERGRSFKNMSKTGNPVIVVLLEQDVTEMNKTLGGSPFYFRNRLRRALADDRSAQPARVEFGGKVHDGWKVTIKPFANDDANQARLGQYAERSYEMTFVDDLPGGLYALKTVTPNAEGGALLVEELTLKGEGAAKPADAAGAAR